MKVCILALHDDNFLRIRQTLSRIHNDLVKYLGQEVPFFGKDNKRHLASEKDHMRSGLGPLSAAVTPETGFVPLGTR